MRAVIARPAATPAIAPERRPVDGAIGWFVSVGVVNILSTISRTAITTTSTVALLASLAALCLILLARRRAPSLAWLGAIWGSFAAASLPIAQAAMADPGHVGIAGWLAWAGPASVGAVVTLWIAVGYATRPGRRLDPIAGPIGIGLFAWFLVAIMTTIVAVTAGERADPAFTWVDVASAPIWAFTPFVVGVAALGVVADLRAGVRRARARLASEATAGPTTDRGWALAAATLRELLPGQAVAEEARMAAERERLAGDLHATVLPSLRRAIAEAEAGGDPERVLGHLRAADLELERLMADRWPVVLDSFGLVGALEDLAERLEASGSPPITLEIEAVDGRPPAPVERATWRFAQVVLDNAIRHGGASSITVTLEVGRIRTRVVVADDGVGFDPTAPTRTGARGLADATRRAADVGAVVRVGRGPESGTIASFDWSSASSG